MKCELSRKKNIVNIVWFKKDLRSSDHAPLHEAALGEYPVLPIYVFEPDYWKQEDAAFRHWEFTKQSLEFLRADLSKLGQALVFRKGKILEVNKPEKSFLKKYVKLFNLAIQPGDVISYEIDDKKRNSLGYFIVLNKSREDLYQIVEQVIGKTNIISKND